MTKITIAGKEYPVVFSLSVARALTKKYGDLDVISKVGDESTPIDDKIDLSIFMLQKLITSGVTYQRMNGEPAPDAPSEEELACLITIQEIPEITKKFYEAFKMKRTVEIESEDENDPNTKTTSE